LLYRNHQEISDSRNLRRSTAPQEQAPINVSVTVGQEPQIFAGKKVEGVTLTGVGAVLTITLSDSENMPLAGVAISEKNTVSSPNAKTFHGWEEAKMVKRKPMQAFSVVCGGARFLFLT
jgi:hypothetical protein